MKNMYVKLLLVLISSWPNFLFVSCLDPKPYNDTVPKKFFNFPLRGQNPSSFNPPSTDGGAQSTFKYSFENANRAILSGGWSRQVSARDLPIATKMAGAQIRLVKGGVRELHWHVASEWVYMIYGQARIQAVDQNALGYVEDVKAGDLWFFPGGIPHAIQGIGNDGAFFVLIFDDGMFGSDVTFLLSDWMKRIPKDVLAKNFGVPASTFNNLPKSELAIFPCPLPQPLASDKATVSKGTGFVPQPLAFFASRMTPNVSRSGGNVKIVDKKNFHATEFAAAIVTLKPGGLRELHWHPNADEWQYYVEGKARLSIFHSNGEARTMDFQAGDVGYVPKSLGHYVENTGDVDVVFLEVFPTPYYEDVSLAEWLAHTPVILVNQTIGTGSNFVNSILKTEAVIRPL